uniref:Uncharacterized protein n=1 Tax=Solanum lycopersicum TaxID=4081 RepID=A0A3Q7GP90_SOLLC
IFKLQLVIGVPTHMWRKYLMAIF